MKTISKWFTSFALACLLLGTTGEAQSILGKHPFDQFVPPFWTQNGNLAALVAALNSATNSLTNATLIPVYNPGANINFVTNVNKTVTVSATGGGSGGGVTNLATTTTNGLMSTNQVAQLNGAQAGSAVLTNLSGGDGTGLLNVGGVGAPFNISDVSVSATNGWLDFTGFANGLKASNFVGAFAGNGNGLTNLTGANVVGAVPLATTATTAGGAPPTGTAGGGLTGTYPNPVVASVGSAALPAAQITGTVIDARLSSNVPLLGGSVFFSGSVGGSALNFDSHNITSDGTGDLSAVSFTGGGGGLTSLTAANINGTIPTANLGSGTASSGTFLRGDQTWSALPAPNATNLIGTVTNAIIAPSVTLNPAVSNAYITLGDYNHINFSSDGVRSYGYFNPSHSGHGEFQWASTRIALLIGDYNADGTGAMQFGSTTFGSSHGARPLWYAQASKFPNSTGDPLGYSQYWAWNTPYFDGTSTQGSRIGFRSEAVDTNGTAQISYYRSGYSGESALDSGPAFNESPGAQGLQVRIGTNANTTGLVYHGSLTKDVAAPTVGANYGVNWDSTNDVDLVISANLNITNIHSFFSRTNQTDTVHLIIYPGLSSYTLTTPANWNWWGPTTNTPIAPTNVPGSTKVRIDVEQRIVGGTTNYNAIFFSQSYAPNIDATAAAFFAAVGGGLSTATTNAINTFCLNAKAHGYFSSLVAFWPMVGASSNACSWNVVNTANYRLAWNGTTATNFTATGVYGDGTAMYANTGLTPSTAVASMNSTMCGVWVRGPALPNDAGYFYGVVGSPSYRFASYRSGTSLKSDGMNLNGTQTYSIGAGGNFVGFLGQNRTTSVLQQEYFNGTTSGGTAIGTATGLANQPLYLWNENFQGSDGGVYSTANLTGAVLADHMTAQNMTDLIADWAALNTTLGR